MENAHQSNVPCVFLGGSAGDLNDAGDVSDHQRARQASEGDIQAHDHMESDQNRDDADVVVVSEFFPRHRGRLADAASEEPPSVQHVSADDDLFIVRENLGPLRSRSTDADNDVIVQSWQIGRGRRRATGTSEAMVRRGQDTGSTARRATNSSTLGRWRADRFELTTLLSLDVLQMCRDERSMRRVLHLYMLGMFNRSMKVHAAAEMRAVVLAAVERRRVEVNGLRQFLRLLSNA